MTEETKEYRNRSKLPIVNGERCLLTFKPCCHKMESALADGRYILFLGKTIFNEQNELIREQRACIQTRDRIPVNQCNWCKAEVVITRDPMGMVTGYGIGLKIKKE